MVLEFWNRYRKFIVVTKMNRILLLLTFILTNCRKDKGLFENDNLTLLRSNYLGTQLRVDGYYYTEANGDVFSSSFFYRNGVLLYSGGAKDSIEAMDSYIKKEFVDEQGFKESSFFWGILLIENTSVKFELFYPSSGGPINAYVSQGVILSDTTFLIQGSYRNQDGKVTDFREENRMFYFRQFSPKPDSTNSFVP